jgi:hypothetical protein
VGALVRNRFVRLDLAEGWIEHARVPRWTLSAIDGAASLSFTMFPVAEGVAMNLATLLTLEHERHRTHEESRRAARRAGRVPAGRFFVDETSWVEGAIFCVQSTHRLDRRHRTPPVREAPAHFEFLAEIFGLCGITREWSISDGKHVVQARLHAETDGAFERAAPACDRMMHSIRFEGPS